MINWTNILPLLLATGILVPAAIIDFRDRRIPNSLCLAGFMIGVILHGLLTGWVGAAVSAGSGLALLAMMFPFFAIGWMGAGDVKLMGAVGAIAGTLPMASEALLGILAVGVLMALLTIAWRNGPGVLAQRLAALGRTRPPETMKTGNTIAAQGMPYGVAIATGSITAMTLGLFSVI